MSLIERAAQRLEQLRLAGADRGVPSPPGAALTEMSPVVVTEPVKTVLERHEAAPESTRPVAKEGSARSRHVVLDRKTMAASKLITPDALRSQLAEEYRVIKRPLIHNAMGKGAAPIRNGNLIMITSALPNEGKSTTAVNLAMSIAAELNNTVMLVDADVARPSLLPMFGLPPSPGLLDLLGDESLEVSDVLLRTDIENFSLLPGGTTKEHATELLASEGMRRLLDDMANRYPDRIIIFDSPPLLLTTEARALATHMGQIVLVVRAEHTSRAEVTQALAAIEACPVTLLLLNQSRAQAGDGYGYGFGYGYGYGGGAAKAA